VVLRGRLRSRVGSRPELDVQRLSLAVAKEHDRDLVSGAARPQQIDERRGITDLAAADLEQDVARAQPRPLRRRSLDRALNLDSLAFAEPEPLACLVGDALHEHAEEAGSRVARRFRGRRPLAPARCPARAPGSPRYLGLRGLLRSLLRRLAGGRLALRSALSLTDTAERHGGGPLLPVAEVPELYRVTPASRLDQRDEARDAFHLFPVHLHDDIARPQACPGGRGAFHDALDPHADSRRDLALRPSLLGDGPQRDAEPGPLRGVGGLSSRSALCYSSHLSGIAVAAGGSGRRRNEGRQHDEAGDHGNTLSSGHGGLLLQAAWSAAVFGAGRQRRSVTGVSRDYS
jgi:hypothetical protein